MEGYGAVSNRANRKLTRKRPFRNIEKEMPKLKKGAFPKTDLEIAKKKLAAEKFAKIGKKARTRFLITESLLYLLFFGLVIAAIYHYFLT